MTDFNKGAWEPKDKSHRKIAWRLSGTILGEQIAAFVVIDLVIAFFISVYALDPGLLPNDPDWLKDALTGVHVWVGGVRYFDVTSYPILIVIGLVEVLCLIITTAKLRGAIRKQLEPLRELRAATDAYASVWQEASDAAAAGTDSGASPEALRRMAEALGRVDARDMGLHFGPDAASEDLRPLAVAIDDMLRRLESSYEAQTKFVSDASHELRTPIAVIQGYANMLSRWGSEDPDTLKESIEAIKSEADAMKQLVNQLLFLARGDNDTLQTGRRPIDARALMEEVLREELMIDSGHEIRAKLPETPVWITGDAGLIKQLLRILVDNSIKYTPADGAITLSLFTDREGAGSPVGPCVRVAVQDEGQGIPADVLPHIFDRFVRADEARARNTGGSGLGLAIAKQIAERHGGSLEVYSRVGIGSRFTVILPLSSVPEDGNLSALALHSACAACVDG
ncbi:MAG: HAMP domain-containing histidine kinase [Clostridiales Family XIII bacterium]|jgi:signal transduction histidine kinase|nr:HAMP domain-containing histidine kinase [Clostridiales Family XIII bacterium]